MLLNKWLNEKHCPLSKIFVFHFSLLARSWWFNSACDIEIRFITKQNTVTMDNTQFSDYNIILIRIFAGTWKNNHNPGHFSMLQMLMMMGDDGEKEFSTEQGIYWRTDVYGPHSDDHDHDIGDHYEVDGNDVIMITMRKRPKVRPSEGFTGRLTFMIPTLAKWQPSWGPPFPPWWRLKGLFTNF